MKLTPQIAGTGLLLLFGCQPYIVPPSVDGISPNWGFNGDETPVNIMGTNLFPGVEVKGGAIDGFDRDFIVSLDGPSTSTLDSVRLNREGGLSAIVPDGLPVGWYDLSVETPSGAYTQLDAAFEVTDTRADHLRLTIDTSNHRVRDFAVLRASIRDPSGGIVEGENPVSIMVEGPEGTISTWGFDYGDVQNPQSFESDEGFSGEFGPSGEIYFGFQSGAPGDFWVKVEAPIRERVVLTSSALVQFNTGEVESLRIEPTDAEDTRKAGEPFEVDLRLTDSSGNIVSGTVATVLLAEGCTGGTFQDVVTFVDDARVTVTPTKACADNAIVGFGVVEGRNIDGSSAPFTVTGGAFSQIDVRVTPASVLAGTEGVSVWLQGQDSWGNNVQEGFGEIALSLEDGPIDIASGLGTYSCATISTGNSSCELGLFRTGDAVVLQASSSVGPTGEGNPIRVHPGPADELFLRSTESVAYAGSDFPVTLSALDAFGNRLPLSTTERDEIVFFDDEDPIGCTASPGSSALDTYDFACVFETAGTENQIRAVLPSLGTSGTYGPVLVHAGAISHLDLDVDASTMSSGVVAGEDFELSFEGRDRYGNIAEGVTVVELEDVGASISPNSVVLTDGVGVATFQTISALSGNSVWAWIEDTFVGGSLAFDVRHAAPDALVAQAPTPWSFAEEEYSVHVGFVDTFGNYTFNEPQTVTLMADTVMYVDAEVNGHRAFSIPAGAAGNIENVEVGSDGWPSEIIEIPVAADCSHAESISPELIGAEDGRTCLRADGLTEVTAYRHRDATTWTLLVDGQSVVEPEATSATIEWNQPGVKRLSSFTIDEDLCGWIMNTEVYANSEGRVTGELMMTSAADLLTAGSASEDAFTQIWIQGRTCTGDLAPGEEVHLQPMLGSTHAYVDSESISGDPIHTVVLNESGEATVHWSMRDEQQGGLGTLLVGHTDGSAFDAHDIEVLGDAVPPTVWRATPTGPDDQPFDTIEVEFSEPILDPSISSDLESYIEIFDSEGTEIDISDYFWTEGQRVLTAVTAGAPAPAGGIWQIVVSEEFRDLAGNRLDGDWDDSAGGEWMSRIGDIPTFTAAMSECRASTGWLRTAGGFDIVDEDDETGIEFFAHVSPAAEWWRMDVVDSWGKLVFRKEFARTGLLLGSVFWDGRTTGGQTLENGTYTTQLIPINADHSPGSSCPVSFVIDNPLEARVSPG